MMRDARRWSFARGSWLLGIGLLAIGPHAASGQPGQLREHSAIVDPVRGRMIVFGGLAGAAATAASDTLWQLDLAVPQWSRLPTIGPFPPRRRGHSAVYDPEGDRVIVFGGLDSLGGVLGDVWALSLGAIPTWSQLSPAAPQGAPVARAYHTAIYDSSRSRIVVFGGEDAIGFSRRDAWALSLGTTPTWTPFPALGPAREQHVAIYDPGGDRMLVFGGFGAPNDLWSLAFGTDAWSPLTPTGTAPSARYGHSAVFDRDSSRMIVFGGNSQSVNLHETWKLSMAGPSWSLLPDVGPTPSARSFQSAVWDSTFQRMIVVGGDPDDSDRTWARALGSQSLWSPLRPVLDVSPATLDLPVATLGDTVSRTFVVANHGMQPLIATGFELPAPAFTISASVPDTLRSLQATEETLTFVANDPPREAQEALVIASNDPSIPRRSIPVGIRVLGLDFDVRLFGDPSVVPPADSVLVIVTPKPEVHIESGTLFYRVLGSGDDFASRPFVRLTADLIARIPASVVTERGVEYYVEMKNGDFTETQPANAPAVDTLAVAPPTALGARPVSASGGDILEGQAVEVEAVLPAGAGFVSGTLHYHRGGDATERSAAFAAGADGPTAAIPATAVGASGLDYWIEVQTFTRLLRFPEAGSANIAIRVRNLMEPATHAGGRYRLLAIPLEFPDSNQVDGMLVDRLGPYDPVDWRLFAYDPAARSNVEFSPNDRRFQTEPGTAFWLVTRGAHRVDNRPIDGLSTPIDRELGIPLVAGWNLIGNPFDFSVAWSDVRPTPAPGDRVAFDSALGSIGRYSPTPPDSLAPFEGYFVHATQAETLWVAPGPSASAPGLASSSSDSSPARLGDAHASSALWRYHLRASTDQDSDDANLFGLDEAAERGFDPHDWPKPPPPPGAWVEVAFAHPEWRERSGLYRHDLRGPSADGETWEVEVRSATPGAVVTLELAALTAAVPEAVRVIDREQGSSILFDRTTKDLHARIVSFGPRAYRLAIAAGSEDYVEKVAQQALSLPTRLTLEPNAPNPFRRATRVRFGLPRADRVSVEIFSVTGQRVAAPLDRVALEPGFHSAIWDGTTSEGGPAPSGVYLLRLTSGGTALSRRLILVR